MNIPEVIKDIRLKSGLTQEKFAQSINISRSSLTQIETGKANATVEILSNIITKYNLDSNVFFSVPKSVPKSVINENINNKYENNNNKSQNIKVENSNISVNFKNLFELRHKLLTITSVLLNLNYVFDKEEINILQNMIDPFSNISTNEILNIDGESNYIFAQKVEASINLSKILIDKYLIEISNRINVVKDFEDLYLISNTSDIEENTIDVNLNSAIIEERRNRLKQFDFKFNQPIEKVINKEENQEKGTI